MNWPGVHWLKRKHLATDGYQSGYQWPMIRKRRWLARVVRVPGVWWSQYRVLRSVNTRGRAALSAWCCAILVARW